MFSICEDLGSIPNMGVGLGGGREVGGYTISVVHTCNLSMGTGDEETGHKQMALTERKIVNSRPASIHTQDHVF